MPRDTTYMWDLKYNRMSLLVKQKQTQTQNRHVAGKTEKGLGRDGLESWD